MRAIELLERRDFRRLFIAVTISELGDAFHYIALMWIALLTGGPLGVAAVRLADSAPALIFGFHGGIVADRWNRRYVMIAADVARGVILIPLAIAGLSGHLSIWGLALAAFLLETATSYFAPAYGALIPALVDRDNVQEANGLIGATTQALSIGGWAVAAALLALIPISGFFVLNAISFFLSASFIWGIKRADGASAAPEESPPLRAALDALGREPALAWCVIVLGFAVTISAGTWIAGIPEYVRSVLRRDAGGLSLLMVGYAAGSIAAGALLARFPIRNKARGSLLAWLAYLPAYGLFLTSSFSLAILGTFLSGLAGAASILLNSAAQEQIDDHVLGRVMGLISLVHRGAHATGLLLISPLFAVFAPSTMFAAAAVAIPLVGIAGLIFASTAERRRLALQAEAATT